MAQERGWKGDPSFANTKDGLAGWLVLLDERDQQFFFPRPFFLTGFHIIQLVLFNTTAFLFGFVTLISC